MGNLVNRNELRRLEKAARDKDKRKLSQWLTSFENQLDNNFSRDYELAYRDEILDLQRNILTAVVYTLYFSEENYIDKNNLSNFMKDMFVSLDLLRTGEYTPKEFRDQLALDNVYVDEYDSEAVYKNI